MYLKFKNGENNFRIIYTLEGFIWHLKNLKIKLKELKNQFFMTIICTSIWIAIKVILKPNKFIDKYIYNLIFVFLSAGIVYLIYLFINKKYFLSKIKI